MTGGPAPTTVLCCVVVHLESLHAHQCAELFENHKLESCCRCESGPDGEESTPESRGTFLCGDLDHTVDGVVVELGVGRLVHQPCTDHIKGCHGTGHEETSSDGGHELREKGLLWQPGQGHNVTLRLIIYAHLGTVENHGTSNVGINTTVEPGDTLVGKQILRSFHNGRCVFAGGHHHSGLQHVKGVCTTQKENTRKF